MAFLINLQKECSAVHQATEQMHFGHMASAKKVASVKNKERRKNLFSSIFFIFLIVFNFLMGCGSTAEVPTVCRDYTACFEIYQERSNNAGDESQMERFSDDGSCWTTPASAQDCKVLCTEALPALKSRYANLDDNVVPDVCTFGE